MFNCSHNQLKSLQLFEDIQFLDMSFNSELSPVFYFDITKVLKVNRAGIKTEDPLKFQKTITITIEE